MSHRRSALTPTLVVEDDAVLRAAIAGALEDAGFHPVECADLTTARAAITRMRPSVVVLDLSLEGEFGGDLLEELAKDDDPPAVVVCSAFRLAHMVAARFSVPCVEKPFEIDVLVKTVEAAHIDRRRPHRQASG
jgi:two-component system, NtrC family, response regulator AtoC